MKAQNRSASGPRGGTGICIERHQLGPRVYVCGRRIHEYHFGCATFALAPVAAVGGGAPRLLWATVLTALIALTGLWLVIKDWPDLRPSTRDTASWRLGIHRLPRADGESS